jgi:hypothetical protein
VRGFLVRQRVLLRCMATEHASFGTFVPVHDASMVKAHEWSHIGVCACHAQAALNLLQSMWTEQTSPVQDILQEVLSTYVSSKHA